MKHQNAWEGDLLVLQLAASRRPPHWRGRRNPPDMPIFQKRTVSLTVAVMLMLSVACASAPQPMQSGKSSPASEGTVQVKKTDNGNTGVSIRVKHVAPASRLAPDAKVDVVWIEPTNGAPQNVGAMNLDDNLEGSLETTTPHARFRVVVTPEASGQAEKPSHDPVFTAEVARAD
jgi:FlaG/FlaF family flagellin (archaellin)